MAEPLQRMSDIINEQNNPVAKAQSVVMKGFDGVSYPAISVNEDGELNIAAASANINNYSLYASKTESGYTYVEKQSATGAWCIMRIDETTGVTDYAKGDSGAATAWTNRASHTYADWDTNNVATGTTLTSQEARIFGMLSDGSFIAVPLDDVTNHLITIDHDHHEIHEGNQFFYTDSVELNNVGVQEYLVTTPNTTRWGHFVFSITGSAITQVQIYEGSTKTGTTLQTVFNSNRNSATTATINIHKGTSGSGDGTLMWQRKSGSSQGASRVGTEANHSEEIILKQNTKYLIRVTSGTASNLTNVFLNWYEHN